MSKLFDALNQWPTVRDILLFVCGAIGMYHETFLIEQADPTLVIAFGAMMGLPVFLRSDEARDKEKKE